MPFPPTPSNTPTNTPTPSITASNTPTVTPSDTNCPNLPPSQTPSNTPTNTMTPTNTPTTPICLIYTINGNALDSYYTGTTCDNIPVNISLGIGTFTSECLISGTIFIYEGSIVSFTACTIEPTNTPTMTKSNTPTPSITASNTATPTITSSNTPTPSVTPTMSEIFEFTGCGYGENTGAACSDAANNRTFYSFCSVITTGCTIYYPSYPTILTGYTHVFIDGAVWEINSTTGVIIQYSATQC